MIKKYRVTSDTDGKTKYIVRYFPKTDKLVCTCPAYTYGKRGYQCKHIKKVRQYLEDKNDKKN